MDIRLGFIVLLLITFVCGVELYSWQMSYSKLFNSVMAAVVMQLIFAWAYKIAANTFLSAIITSLLIAICLRIDYYFYYTLAAFFALSSKYFFQSEKRLIFNPTVFGLFIVLTFMGNARIGFFNMPSYAVGIFVALGILLQLYAGLKRFEASISYFLVSWGFYNFYRPEAHSSQDLDWVIFASIFIMLDRSSIPNSASGRIIFGVGIGILQFIVCSSMPISHVFVYVAMVFYLLKVPYERFIDGKDFYWNGLIQRPLNSN